MPAYTEYIDGMRLLLEGEGDCDIQVLQDIRLHYSSFITLLIKHFPGMHRPCNTFVFSVTLQGDSVTGNIYQ